MRKPDVTIGPADKPYMERWHLIPRNGIFDVYLHKISRSDDARALHDHRADNLSIILRGGYKEYLALRSWNKKYYDTEHPQVKIRGPGSIVYRKAEQPHRLVMRKEGVINHQFNSQSQFYKQVNEKPVWTLWIKFGDRREWGFYPDHKWMPWKEYIAKYGDRDDCTESNYKA